MEFVLRNSESGALFTFPQNADPRTWKPGQRHVLRVQIDLPESLPIGTYDLFLFLPDPSPRLRWDPRYAYRMANGDMWDAERGLNALISDITIR